MLSFFDEVPGPLKGMVDLISLAGPWHFNEKDWHSVRGAFKSGTAE